jgi:hypothetical protein
MGFALRDLSDIEPSTGGGGSELLPVDDYRLQADEISDENVTKDGTGKYVTAKFTVIEGELEGSSFYVNFNIENKNPKAVEIAWRDLSAWGHAVGVLTGDSDALLYKPFMARVGIEKSKDPQYKDKNKILKYYRQDEIPAVAPPALAVARPVAVARPAAVAATGARPWAKRA